MKKYMIIICSVTLLFVIGIFSVTISKGNFYFTTKYYNKPIDAYNANSTYNAVYGNTQANIEVGMLMLDNENAIFIGGTDENRIVIAEMSVKEGKYASKGNVRYYDLIVDSDEVYTEQINTSNGCVKMSLFFDKEVKEGTNYSSIKMYPYINGHNICIMMEQVGSLS